MGWCALWAGWHLNLVQNGGSLITGSALDAPTPYDRRERFDDSDATTV